MNKFKLIIVAVAVGFMPAVAFSLESTNPLVKIIPGYQAANFLTHKMNVDPYASVTSIPKLTASVSNGEADAVSTEGFTCALLANKQAGNGEKILSGDRAGISAHSAE